MKVIKDRDSWLNVLCKLVFVCLLAGPILCEASESATYIQQLQRIWSRTLGDVLGFFGLIFKNLNPPTTVDLIRRKGYPCETHYIKTADNVILEVHRIPHGPTLELFRLNRRVPVVLTHGIAQSSSDWFLNTPTSDSLGFLLSDAGYDVWVANHRGNLNKNSGLGVVSWNHSFAEMGVFDVPAIVGYVTQYTGFDKIHYIGFSMGNTALMTALAKIPQLNDRIRLGILLGPSVIHDNWYNGWFKLVAPLAIPGHALQNTFGAIPLIHPWAAGVLHRILPVICHPRIDVIGVCLLVNNLLFGYDKGQITKEKLATITQVSPTPISSKLILHYLQELGTGRFCEYDYGKQKNLQIYGRDRPPDYNLTNVRAPISIMVGKEDILAHRVDAMALAKRLPNVVDLYFVSYQHFTHLDFCYAKDVSSLVYDHVLNMLQRF